jgi:hypothetical protein
LPAISRAASAKRELLDAAESLPIHVLSGPDMMARSMIEFHPPFCGEAMFSCMVHLITAAATPSLFR